MSEVSVCDSLAFLQHICRSTFSTLVRWWPPVVVGRDDGDVLGGVIGPDEGLHRLLDELLLLNITQTSFSSKRLGELGRALDGRDVVNERLGRLAVQLGFLEDDDGDWRCPTCRSC